MAKIAVLVFQIIFILIVMVVCVDCSRRKQELLEEIKKYDDRLQVLEERVQQMQLVLTNESDDKMPPLTSLEGFPKDCHDLYKNGIKADGLYAVSPDGRYPFYVYCDMTGGGWTVIQRRFGGSVNFYQKWDDYVKGFGELNGEHWLGLEKIHKLTKDGIEVHFEVSFTKAVDIEETIRHYRYRTASKIIERYKVFSVHAAASSYKMTVSESVPHRLDGELEKCNGTIFSTYDTNPRIIFEKKGEGGGWWYKPDKNSLGNINGIFSKVWGGHSDPNILSSTLMSVKQIYIE